MTIMSNQKTSHRNNHKPQRQPLDGLLPRNGSWNWTRISWIISTTLVLLFIFWLLKPVFALLAASAGIAYICDPLIDRFEKKGFSRSTAIGICFASFVMGVILFFVLLIPPLFKQINQFSSDIAKLLENTEQYVQLGNRYLSDWTGSEINIDISNLKKIIPEWIANSSPELQKKAFSVISGLFTQGLGFLNTILNLLLLPIFTFYLLRDWDILVEKFRNLLPHSYRAMILDNLQEVDLRLNAFVRGQIKVCLYLAVLYTIGLLLVGIDLAIPIGILSGLLFIVPYLGTAFGIISSLLLALIDFGFSWQAIGVIVVFIVVQLIEGYYLTPKIIGESVGLSPLVVMVALLVGASLMGIWGMFLAIPITAILSVIGTDWLKRYKDSHFYLDKHD